MELSANPGSCGWPYVEAELTEGQRREALEGKRYHMWGLPPEINVLSTFPLVTGRRRCEG